MIGIQDKVYKQKLQLYSNGQYSNSAIEDNFTKSTVNIQLSQTDKTPAGLKGWQSSKAKLISLPSSKEDSQAWQPQKIHPCHWWPSAKKPSLIEGKGEQSYKTTIYV